MKNKLKSEQPLVYQTLTNSINKNKLSHALMFLGESGTAMLPAALFLAQSLICEESQLACETCDSCLRIKEGNYNDVVVLDGSSTSIKKDEIITLQEQFKKTALEKSGKKVYILNRAENATAAALNSLLKFLEEPQGSEITAILVVEDEAKILPTILSRCQILPFKTLTKKSSEAQAISANVSKEDSIILSHFIRDVDFLVEVSQQESYQKAVYGVKELFNNILNMDMVMITLDCEVFNEKASNSETLNYFLSILIGILHDVSLQTITEIVWYDNAIKTIQELNVNIRHWTQVLLETKDKNRQSFNLGLLINQCILSLKEGL